MVKERDESTFDVHCDPDNPKILKFHEIKEAMKRIRSGIKKTSLDLSDRISHVVGAKIYLKKEFTQFTGSFKERGARNALLKLSEEEKQLGVYAASAGNHGLAMSYHGKNLNIPINIYMPVYAPLIKVENCKKLGANVVLTGETVNDARDAALREATKKGGKYVNGYDNIDVLAGAGTVALEILEDLPDVDIVIIPIGGGGLIAGMSVALKKLKPSVKIIGVQAASCPAFHVSLKNNKYTYVKSKPTIADGLAVEKIGVNAFATAKKHIDYSFCVDEEDIAVGVYRFLEWERLICEGAGAISVSSLLIDEIRDLVRGKKVVCVLSGGNIDITKLKECLDKGLALDRRIIRFNVLITERPDSLAQVINITSKVGVIIKDIRYERGFEKLGIMYTRVRITCETIGMEHADKLEEEVKKVYKSAYFYPNHDDYEKNE
uniref:Serine racemase n=1 Tax=Strongyloides papillosus TaxID=174720 RepID=A0A0N5BID2_STREA